MRRYIDGGTAGPVAGLINSRNKKTNKTPIYEKNLIFGIVEVEKYYVFSCKNKPRNYLVFASFGTEDVLPKSLPRNIWHTTHEIGMLLNGSAASWVFKIRVLACGSKGGQIIRMEPMA